MTAKYSLIAAVVLLGVALVAVLVPESTDIQQVVDDNKVTPLDSQLNSAAPEPAQQPGTVHPARDAANSETERPTTTPPDDTVSGPSSDSVVADLLERYGENGEFDEGGPPLEKWLEEFADEPRNAAWADATETLIKQYVDQSAFGVTYTLSTVECRSTRCIISATIDAFLFASQQDVPGGHWSAMMRQVQNNVAAASVPFSNYGIEGMHYDPETKQLVLTSFWRLATEQDRDKRKGDSVAQSVATTSNARDK